MGTNTKLLSNIYNVLERFLNFFPNMNVIEACQFHRLPSMRKHDLENMLKLCRRFFEWFYMSQAHFSDPCSFCLRQSKTYCVCVYSELKENTSSFTYWQIRKKNFLCTNFERVKIDNSFILHPIMSVAAKNKNFLLKGDTCLHLYSDVREAQIRQNA